jgi:hypothetical protein
MIMEAHDLFWNREQWQPFSFGTTDSNWVEGFKVLGQCVVSPYRGERILYLVPDGVSAYVTVFVHSSLALFGTFDRYLNMSIVGPEVPNRTSAANTILYFFRVPAWDVFQETFCLEAGYSIRFQGSDAIQGPSLYTATAFGTESLEV